MVTVPLGRSAPGTPIHEAAEEAVAALRLLRAAYPGVYRVTFEHGGQHLTAEHGVHTPESLVAIYDARAPEFPPMLTQSAYVGRHRA